MLREIIIPKSENYSINIPKEYINQKIEILVFPLANSNEKTKQDILEQTAGILSLKEVDPVAWQRSLRDDYER